MKIIGEKWINKDEKIKIKNIFKSYLIQKEGKI